MTILGMRREKKNLKWSKLYLKLIVLHKCSIPFSDDDLSISVKEKDFSDVKPAAELLENPAFQFLQE